MAKRRRGVAVLAVAAVAGAGVAAGVFLTRGMPGDADASSTAAPTSSAAPLGAETDFEDVSPTPTASIGPDPDAGEPVASDEPVVVEGSDVDVSITYYGFDPATNQVEVGGFVAGIVEDGGSCTVTLTGGGQTVTGTSEALADATTTDCGAVAVPGDELGDGTWQAVLSYSSADHSGSSAPVDVEVAR
jgi:plastocyanin